MEDNLGKKAVEGAVWASVDRFGSMVIQFIVNLILARLLLPVDFGMIGMLTIFIAVSQTLIDGGFGSALIQKKNPTQKDYSTIFFWNLIFSVILYLILFICSPLIAKFYSLPLLSKVLRVMALSLIITSIYTIQKNSLQKKLAFKKIAIINLSAYTLGACVALYLAYKNFGVWSLVMMQLIYGTLSFLFLEIVTRWIPKMCISKNSLKELFGFGGYIMAANILQTICQNLQGIIIGKRFSATQMGYFSQAYKLDQITSYSIPQVIVQVMYPVYASIQDNRQRLNSIVIMNMRVLAFIVYPILSTLILSSGSLITLLYGEKWLPAVSYFRILCVGGYFVCLQNLNFYAVAAVGKSRSLFNWSFYKWGFLLIMLIVGMNFGMFGILWGLVLSNINVFITNMYLSAKHTGLSSRRQLLSITPILVLNIISICIGYILYFNNIHIIICCLSMISFYVFSAKIYNFKALNDTILMIKRIFRN